MRVKGLSQQERELLDRCKRGDEAAWAELYRTHSQDIAVFVRGTLGIRVDVEDVVHRVFLEFLSSLGRFRGQASLRTWLHRIAKHVVQKEIRTAIRRRRKVEAYGHFVAMTSGTGGREQQRARERWMTVERALDALDMKFRMVWVMRELEGLAFEEIAAALKMRVPTVRSRHARAKARIVEWVEAAEASEDGDDPAGGGLADIDARIRKRMEVLS